MNFIRNVKTPMLVPTLALLAAAMPARAHHFMDGSTPTTAFEGFLSGMAHPVIGADHLAFVVVAGLLAFALSGARRYLAPLTFVATALAGTGIHLMGADLPLTELVIASSVILGGALLATRTALPVLLLGVGMAAFGLFHGYAYGEAIVGAETGPLASYLLGFSIIQYAVVLGVVFGMDRLARHSAHFENLTTRIAGVVAALTGGLFLAMNLA